MSARSNAISNWDHDPKNVVQNEISQTQTSIEFDSELEETVGDSSPILENTQRDLNIALINELSVIFNRLDIDTMDVLDAASSKWNFLKFLHFLNQNLYILDK